MNAVARWSWTAARLIVAVLSWPVALLLLTVWLTGIALLPVVIGLPVLAGVTRGIRRFADLARGAAAGELDEPVTAQYLAAPEPTWRASLAVLRDRHSLLDAVWLLLHATAGMALFGVGLLLLEIGQSTVSGGVGPLGILTVVPLTLGAVVVLAVPWLWRGYAHLVRILLGGPDGALSERVEQLTRSRAATVDASAAELRRIERDLHDGAQARLAALGMTLGLAASLVRSDPDRAEALLGEARGDARAALAELRDLVRGIHPPVLADRGLAGGLAAAALLCPVPVEVDVDLPGRAHAPVESAVYFAATEALTNVARHADATRARLAARHVDGVLRVIVADDGVGGADPARGTGLTGIRRRLAAFDGRLTLTSPPGGPTELTMELPCPLIPNPVCASSSPRTTSSSATG